MAPAGWSCEYGISLFANISPSVREPTNICCESHLNEKIPCIIRAYFILQHGHKYFSLSVKRVTGSLNGWQKCNVHNRIFPGNDKVHRELTTLSSKNVLPAVFFIQYIGRFFLFADVQIRFFFFLRETSKSDELVVSRNRPGGFTSSWP